MSEASHRVRKAAVERVLQGPATTSGEHRRAAFDNKKVPAAASALIDKVANNAWKVTDEDVAAAKAAGLAEDAIFELTVSAAMGQASRQLDSARAAVDAAFDQTAVKESA
jgi:alkylhydroperoxidase family enzyme